MNSLSDLTQTTTREVEFTLKAAMFDQLRRPIHFRSCWDSKIDIYVHQIETALRVLGMDPPRVLLADEVGLGKTIEALLIVKELISLGRINRILVVVPSSLLNQWQYEMETKFDLYPIVINRSNIKEALGREDESLFLVSIDYAKRHTDDFTRHAWDLVIFDEAHHLRRHLKSGDRVVDTLKYKLGKELSLNTYGLLLLTATPMQLNEFEFYSLLQLIDPEIFETFEDFEYYYKTLLPRIVNAIEDTASAGAMNIPELHLLYHRGRDSLGHFELASMPDECEDPIEIQENLKSLIIFPYFMIRYRKREEFPDIPPREVSTIPIEYTDAERHLYDEVTELFKEIYRRSYELNDQSLRFLTIIYQQMLTSSPIALANSFRRRIGKLENEKESEAEPLDGGMDDWTESSRMLPQSTNATEAGVLYDFMTRLEELPVDSKLDGLVKLAGNILLKHPDEKIIIFTRFLDTQAYLARTLSEHFEVVTFNGQMDNMEKDRNVRRFRTSADVMICSEAGGEGRNFQFCHIMINYDLPWNPVKLEQRIGRIDRIGQERTVMVYNMAIDGTVEERIYEVLVDRLLRFQNLVGTADTVLGNIETDIAKIVLAQDRMLEEEYDRFTQILDAKIEKAKSATKYFDNLTTLGRKRIERSKASQEVHRDFPDQELGNFIVSYIANLDGAKVHSLGGKRHSVSIPKNSDLGNRYEIDMKVTFDREVATTEENIEFLTEGHAFVSKVLASLLSNNETMVSFEENVSVSPGIYWCFYGGEAEGYCLVSTSRGYTKIISPEHAVNFTFYDSNTQISCDDEVTTGMKRHYEQARLAAERELEYPEGGADLVCVRVINWDNLKEAD